MRRLVCTVLCFLLVFSMCPGYALGASIPKSETPDYKVAFYHFDCYHMQDDSGRRSGYGYEMMQGIARQMQCTFSYVGYDKSAEECVDMLREGKIDIYTAAKKTPEREREFVFSEHPAITSTTCMNVKVGNKKVVAGDYSTYNGLKIGLLKRHTYNDRFIAWANKKGFRHTIVYYDTPTELTDALVQGDVDALVNSYIRTPEDEETVEDFGQTPYYIMARKDDAALIESIDDAIDDMSIETPNWRVELFNKYYGSQELNTELTQGEEAMLERLRAEKATVSVIMNPEDGPYSYFEKGEPKGISADICRAVSQKLGIDCEFLPVSSKAEYFEKVASGEADVVLNYDDSYQVPDEARYKSTNGYLSTSVSLLRERGSSGRVSRLGVVDGRACLKEVLDTNWPDAEVTEVDSTAELVAKITSGEIDAGVLMSYSAQKLARDDVQNRLRVEVVPNVTMQLAMGVNANLDHDFYGLWEKTLKQVASRDSARILQSYVEVATTPTLIAYLFDHPSFMIALIAVVLLMLFLVLLYLLSLKSKNRQAQTSRELAAALRDAENANAAKQNFFSKMSHDIRTPLNVVLGMTQIASQYKDDEKRLQEALDNINSEGNYLLVLINSILDVNQLEHGHVELQEKPFDPVHTAKESIEMLRPLAEKKEQKLEIVSDESTLVVVGDEPRFGQIMINIVSNAIKYTDIHGRIEVSLACRPDGHVRFVCKDNGIGMSEEFIEHITEDYVRAEDSRVSKTQGTGLGMSVVKGFTDLMGGTLDVESTLGEGSVFTVEIPFALASDEQREEVLRAAAKSDDEQSSCRYVGKKVLLAEDNALNAEIATALLESIGLEVDWADDGLKAVKRFESSSPGEFFAVFMDMQMPVMDGVQATQRIRASAHPDHGVPIFAMTANTFALDKRRCQDAGMDGYIPKPINLNEIAQSLRGIDGEA